MDDDRIHEKIELFLSGKASAEETEELFLKAHQEALDYFMKQDASLYASCGCQETPEGCQPEGNDCGCHPGG